MFIASKRLRSALSRACRTSARRLASDVRGDQLPKTLILLNRASLSRTARSSNPPHARALQRLMGRQPHGCKMTWLLNLPPFEGYLIAIPAIMVGSILLVGAIVLLFESRHDDDARLR